MAALQRIAAADLPAQVVISTGGIEPRIAQWIRRAPLQATTQAGGAGENERHARPNIRNAYVAPGDDIEWLIVDIWQKLLGIDQVGIHDNFFDLGGHSLLATQVIGRVGATFKMEVPIRALFEEPTVAALARVLTEREPKPGQAAKIARAIRKIRSASAEDMRKALDQQRKARGIA